jgi:hypothetical protein
MHFPRLAGGGEDAGASFGFRPILSYGALTVVYSRLRYGS